MGGSPCWMVPEILDSDGDGYDEKVDIWALGITIIELVEGSPPYHDTTVMSAILAIVQKDPPKLNSTAVASTVRDIVQDCLKKNPEDRPSATELLTKYKYFLSKGKNKKISS